MKETIIDESALRVVLRLVQQGQQPFQGPLWQPVQDVRRDAHGAQVIRE